MKRTATRLFRHHRSIFLYQNVDGVGGPPSAAVYPWASFRIPFMGLPETQPFRPFTFSQKLNIDHSKDKRSIDKTAPVVPPTWNLMFYSFTANDLQKGTFQDLAKLTAQPCTTNVCAHLLLDTATLGSYRIRVCGDCYINGMSIRRVPSQNMTDPEVLRNFIITSCASDPAKHYALVLGGHGCGYYLHVNPKNVISVTRLAEIIRHTGIHFSWISLDSCLMANLEAMYELCDCADYLVACEDYCPWNGIISSYPTNNVDICTSVEQLLPLLVNGFLMRNSTPDSDPSDISVVKSAGVCELVDVVKELDLRVTDFEKDGICARTTTRGIAPHDAQAYIFEGSLPESFQVRQTGRTATATTTITATATTNTSTATASTTAGACRQRREPTASVAAVEVPFAPVVSCQPVTEACFSVADVPAADFTSPSDISVEAAATNPNSNSNAASSGSAASELVSSRVPTSRIDANFPHLHDLYSAVMALPPDRLPGDLRARFESAFRRTVIYYRQNVTKRNPHHHGLSVCVAPELDDTDKFKAYRFLSLRGLVRSSPMRYNPAAEEPPALPKFSF